MSINAFIRTGSILAGAVLLAGFATGRATASEGGLDAAVDALIKVLGDPKAAGEKLEDTNRAINALVAIGQPAVPKLIDAVLGDNTNAWVYAGHTLKQMRQIEIREPVRQ